jgi:hypothetical protein
MAIWRRTGMNPYVNEDAAWQHIQDLQREMENSRLMAAGNPPAEVVAVVWLGRRLVRLGSAVWNLSAGQLHRAPVAAPAVQSEAAYESDDQMEIA